MQIDWTKHLTTEEDKKRFEQTVQSAKPVLDRLKQIIQAKEEALGREEMSLKSFEEPNWEYKQAFKNGIRHAYTGMKTMIDLDQQIIRI